MVVEGFDITLKERPQREGDRDLFKLAYALGCPPMEIPPPDGDDRDFRLYVIQLSKADRRVSGDLDDDDWTPVEETPEERAKRLEEGLAAVAEYEAEYGAFTPEQEAWAAAVLDRLGIGVDT